MSETKSKDTNRSLSNKGDFFERCSKAGIRASKRQVSKFRQHRGYLYRFEKGLENPPLVQATPKAPG